jgi:hypothetical protein
MGEIAGSMLDGSMCEQCGEYLGEAVGYPRCCGDCDDGDPQIETFRILKKQNQEKRAHNREASQVELTKRGYQFEAKNGDAHLIVQTSKGVVDFWPGTGKFRIRSSADTGRGLDDFITSCPPVESASEREIPWASHMTPFAIQAYEKAGFRVVGQPSEAQ